jgi:hypothetical protein
VDIVAICRGYSPLSAVRTSDSEIDVLQIRMTTVRDALIHVQRYRLPQTPSMFRPSDGTKYDRTQSLITLEGVNSNRRAVQHSDDNVQSEDDDDERSAIGGISSSRRRRQVVLRMPLFVSSVSDSTVKAVPLCGDIRIDLSVVRIETSESDLKGRANSTDVEPVHFDGQPTTRKTLGHFWFNTFFARKSPPGSTSSAPSPVLPVESLQIQNRHVYELDRCAGAMKKSRAAVALTFLSPVHSVEPVELEDLQDASNNGIPVDVTLQRQAQRDRVSNNA